jgi:hypothetical protein
MESTKIKPKKDVGRFFADIGPILQGDFALSHNLSQIFSSILHFGVSSPVTI